MGLKAYDLTTGAEVKVGESVTSFRGETGTLTYLERANEPDYGRDGKVVVKRVTGSEWGNYARVWNLRVVRVADPTVTPNSDHTDRLADRPTNHPDRPMYAWVTEGELCAGTLADYARHVENGHYSGNPASSHPRLTISETLWGVNDQGALAPVRLEFLWTGDGSDKEGYRIYAYYRAVVRDQRPDMDGRIIDAADYRIGLRA